MPVTLIGKKDLREDGMVLMLFGEIVVINSAASSPEYQLGLYTHRPGYLPEVQKDPFKHAYEDKEVGTCLIGGRAHYYFHGPEVYLKLFKDIEKVEDFREVKRFWDKHFSK